MTDRRGVITYVNPEFVRVYGYAPEEIVGVHTPRILKGGRTLAHEYTAFWQQLAAQQVVRREFVNRTKTGSLVYVESSANPIVEHGKCVGFLAVQRDVTDRKLLERQFVQAQKMEAIGRLAGGIAHDFNNLLTAILGYSELVADRVRADPSLEADVDEIRKAGERASRLTRQLLAFSRQQVLQPQVLDLNIIVLDLAKMLARVIGEDVHLDVVTQSRVASVKVDAGQVEQLILNLAVNARDAMPDGGTLRVTTADVTVEPGFARCHGAAPGAYVALAVNDTGAGMSPEVLERVCEPFFTTKPCGKGTGLGLATVLGVVKQSGGFLTIDSTLGAGTTVTAYLPATDDAVAFPEVPPAPTARGSETVLIVEDEAGIRQVMKRTLERHGYTVLVAACASDAIEMAESCAGGIDLLLSDVVMPDISGSQLAQRIVGIQPAIRVLYVSGFPNRIGVDIEMGSRASFLPKPFAPAALLQKVRACLTIPALPMGSSAENRAAAGN